jgi:hypothetical protein
VFVCLFLSSREAGVPLLFFLSSASPPLFSTKCLDAPAPRSEAL